VEYDIQLGEQFGHGEVMDVPALLARMDHPWWNRTLTQVNDSVVRIGCFQGEFHWHKHEKDDEFFFVLEGSFVIDFEDRTVTLEKHQGITVSKGVMHRPRSPERSVVLMVETSGIVPTGD
jgi:mannose-6-phosphate isomerase-like protein (cupin superfamily)